jgi:hypothetical protein
MDVVDDVLDYARTLWSDYVLGLTAQRQRERIYNPVSERTNLEDWSQFFSQVRDDFWAMLLRVHRMLISPAGWAAVLGIALIAAAAYVLRTQWRRLRNSDTVRIVRRWRSRVTRHFVAGDQSPQRITVDFYRRLEQLLGQLGMARRPSVTPREFAARAASQLQGPEVSHAIRCVPAQIVDALYQVRFGHIDLRPEDIEAIDIGLDDLERVVAVQTISDRESQRTAS